MRLRIGSALTSAPLPGPSGRHDSPPRHDPASLRSHSLLRRRPRRITPPRTSSGAPDLQGDWTNLSLTYFERPKAYKSLIVTDTEAAAAEVTFKFHNRLDGIKPKPAPDAAGKPPPPPNDDDVGQATSEFPDRDVEMLKIGGGYRSSILVEPAGRQDGLHRQGQSLGEGRRRPRRPRLQRAGGADAGRTLHRRRLELRRAADDRRAAERQLQDRPDPRRDRHPVGDDPRCPHRPHGRQAPRDPDASAYG